MGTENVSSTSTGQNQAPSKSSGQPIDDTTYKEMLNILQDLTDHTHVFYDDYGTACNCNCNCTCCVRGMVW